MKFTAASAVKGAHVACLAQPQLAVLVQAGSLAGVPVVQPQRVVDVQG